VALYDSIASIYDPWSRSVTEDIGFYVDAATASGGGGHGHGRNKVANAS